MRNSLSYWRELWQTTDGFRNYNIKDDNVAKLLALLCDYAAISYFSTTLLKIIKNDESLKKNRFFTGRWNRSHTDAVINTINDFLNNTEKDLLYLRNLANPIFFHVKIKKEYDDIKILLAYLKRNLTHKKLSPNGALTNLLKVVQEKNKF